MLVLIDKPSFELLLEGQMDYQRDEVQGQLFRQHISHLHLLIYGNTWF